MSNLPFQIVARVNRGDVAVFIAQHNDERISTVRYALGNVKRRLETASSWASDPRLQNGSALDPAHVARASEQAELRAMTAHDKRIEDESSMPIGDDAKQMRNRRLSLKWEAAKATLAGDDDRAAKLRSEAHELDEDDEEKISQAEQLVRLALEHYRIGVDDRGEPFAVRKNGPNIALMFKGSRDALRANLSKLFREHFQKTPSTNALIAAMTCLGGEALDAAPEPTFQRVAPHEYGIVVDLGNSAGRCAIVSADGWKVCDTSPVLFRRSALTAPMPEPKRGGDLLMLRVLVNINDDGWPLLLGWLIAALIPWIEHPILMLGGQAGSGKTTTAILIIGLCDSSTAPVRSQPRDPETWAISAAGSWAVCVDNVSTIPEWFSDCLCKAVTGDGWLRRKLWTDGELAVLSFRRAVILTSIDAGALRGDLGDRLVLVDLDPIAPDARKPRTALDDDYASNSALIFGALLDLLAKVLRELPRVKLDQHPRMGDFGRVLAAIDSILGTQSLKSYLGQRERIAEDVVEADGVAKAIINVMERSNPWTGKLGDLLAAIKPEHPPKGWPDSIPKLRGRVKRAATALEAIGITITKDRDSSRNRSRIITIQKGTQPIVQSVQTSEVPNSSHGNDDLLRTIPNDRGPLSSDDRPTENHNGTIENAVSDHADVSDDQIPPTLIQSEEAENWGEV